MFWLQPLATYLMLSQLRFPALLNIIDTGITGIAIAKPLQNPLLILPNLTLVISYTGQKAPDFSRPL